MSDAPASARAPNIVDFRNVTKRFGSVTVIRDVTFSVPDLTDKGEFVTSGAVGCSAVDGAAAHRGPSAAPSASEGTVLVAGRPVERPGPTAAVFQDYTSFERTVEDNVAFGLECRGVTAHSAARRPRVDRQGRSGREARRVEVSERTVGRHAAARRDRPNTDPFAAHHLMDEPFGALDPTTRLHMQALLVELWKDAQATVFFVTHSIDEAVYLGDRVYVTIVGADTILREMTLPPPDRPPGRCCASRIHRACVRTAQLARSAAGVHEGRRLTWRARFETRPPGQTCKAPEWRLSEEAFLFRWNLLFFLGGAAAAALTPLAGVVLPLVAAGEIAYLTGLVSVPRFRAAIDAKVHAEGKPATGAVTPAPPPVSVVAMLAGLPAEARTRFQRLHARCVEMRGIAAGVRGAAGDQGTAAEEIRTPGLDRLLWLFLRLLLSKAALDRFLQSMNEQEISARLAELRKSLDSAKGDERISRSLQDSIASAELRLDNYARARKNGEFVSVELDRLEGKIQALAEMTVNRQDPDFLSSQVDSAADSMRQTEKAVSDLQHLTGLQDQLEEPPPSRNRSAPGTPLTPEPAAKRRAEPRTGFPSGPSSSPISTFPARPRCSSCRNAGDLVRVNSREPVRYGVLAGSSPNNCSEVGLVLHYDLGRGLRVCRRRRTASQGDGGGSPTGRSAT